MFLLIFCFTKIEIISSNFSFLLSAFPHSKLFNSFFIFRFLPESFFSLPSQQMNCKLLIPQKSWSFSILFDVKILKESFFAHKKSITKLHTKFEEKFSFSFLLLLFLLLFSPYYFYPSCSFPCYYFQPSNNKKEICKISKTFSKSFHSHFEIV